MERLSENAKSNIADICLMLNESGEYDRVISISFAQGLSLGRSIGYSAGYADGTASSEKAVRNRRAKR